jgi:hypothetical protein
LDERPKFALEIKCPVKGAKLRFPHYYYLQVQLEIRAINARYAYCVLWDPCMTVTFRMERDDEALVVHMMKSLRELKSCTEEPTQLPEYSFALKEYCYERCCAMQLIATTPSLPHCQKETE